MTPPTDKEMKKNPECISKFRYEQRNIVVKRFGELPIADLEIVLPDKEVRAHRHAVLSRHACCAGSDSALSLQCHAVHD